MAPARVTNDESAENSNPDKVAVQSGPYFVPRAAMTRPLCRKELR